MRTDREFLDDGLTEMPVGEWIAIKRTMTQFDFELELMLILEKVEFGFDLSFCLAVEEWAVIIHPFSNEFLNQDDEEFNE